MEAQVLHEQAIHIRMALQEVAELWLFAVQVFELALTLLIA